MNFLVFVVVSYWIFVLLYECGCWMLGGRGGGCQLCWDLVEWRLVGIFDEGWRRAVRLGFWSAGWCRHCWGREGGWTSGVNEGGRADAGPV